MGGDAGAIIKALQDELGRLAESRSRLEDALTLSDQDRAALRAEVRVLDARVARLHDELSYTHRRQADLHDELDDAIRQRMRLSSALGGGVATPAEGETESEADKAEPEPADEKEPEPAPEPPPAPALVAAPTPSAIEVRDLRKTFRMPAHQMETLKERVLHPLRSRASKDLVALDGVSFDVAEGEFFGIVGPNGSGKSTLLKLLASVYASDAGSARVGGTVAPFIELGVGLNPELAAFDNVVVSGVMMGLEPERARALYPEIIDFAGLEEFTQVRLKNYSSGMRVRLAFAVMAKVDADILLVDEVLAVGDAEFRVKCLERLKALREEGKTIVFVTHAMETMEEHCDRAILLREGRLDAEGSPAEVAAAYARGPAEEGEEKKPPLRVVEQ